MSGCIPLKFLIPNRRMPTHNPMCRRSPNHQKVLTIAYTNLPSLFSIHLLWKKLLQRESLNITLNPSKCIMVFVVMFFQILKYYLLQSYCVNLSMFVMCKSSLLLRLMCKCGNYLFSLMATEVGKSY